MKKKLHKIGALALLNCLMLLTTAHSQQIIFKNDITGTNPSQFNPYTTGQITDPNVTPSGIGRSSGLVATTGNDGYVIREWNTPSIDLSAYFEFTITPNSGYAINFTNLNFKTGFSGAPNNTPFLIRSSISNFTTNIAFTKENVFAPVVVDFSAAAYQNVSTAITFRIYPFGSVNVSDTFSIYEFTYSGTTSTLCNPVVPNFPTLLTICNGSEINLGNVFPNGISGTWSPAFNNTISNMYTFTPNSSQCAVSQIVSINITSRPLQPVGAIIQEFTAGQTLADLTVLGTNLNWFATLEAALNGNPILNETQELTEGNTYYVTQTLNNCPSEALAITVVQVLNTDDFEKSGFYAYPNPVQDELNFKSIDFIQHIQLFNTYGQEILSLKPNAMEAKLDCSEIASGIYLVRIDSVKKSKTFKILKK